MRSLKFYTALSQLGEFRCAKDLRRFNGQARRNRHLSKELYLNHFGHCKNGSYHHCEFILDPKPHSEVIYYYKLVQRDGASIRLRGGKPLKTWGRGRPPGPAKKKRT